MLPQTVVITPPVWDTIAAVGIGGIAVIAAAAWALLFARGDRRRLLVLGMIAVGIMALSAAAASSGLLARFDRFPPPMLFMVVGIFAMAFAFAFSPWGRDGAAHLTLPALIGLQTFRLPLELVMHRAYTAGIMPVELSYSGYNFDIATGAGALALWTAYKAGRAVPRYAVWAWNLWGSYCLLAIAVIAVTTSPIVRLFGDDPGHLNTWVLYFPYVWLPVVLVTIAIAGHLVLWRKLLHAPQSAPLS